MLLARRALSLLALSLSLLFIAPMSSSGQQTTTDSPEIRVARPATVVDGSYRLSPSEVVKVTVFQEEDLTTTARISEDGTIQLPLIRSVHVGGKTVREAAASIEAALRQDYLVQPQVSVTVTEFAKRRFAIIGQVQRPGTYEIPANENLDVIQAVGLAGGYTRMANPSKILVKRVVDGNESVYRLNGKELAGSASGKSFRIMPGDTITVAESAF